MTQQEFLHTIYSNIKPGMVVIKPIKNSKILSISKLKHIWYRIGIKNEKNVSEKELKQIYKWLDREPLPTKVIARIVTPAKTCNVTTIKWMLTHFNLAVEKDINFEKKFVKTW